MSKPLLSIGMIFKNEIRCLERCLKSLQPLREAIPCELVMADTGSDDGSREVAERYADILFDFPWVNDFAAARNAVMDHSKGAWHLFIDADEWLEPDVAELVKFLTGKHNFNFFAVKIRNYLSPELETGGLYMDSTATRLVRVSSGARFEGAVHETWNAGKEPIIVLAHTLFHHDGYLFAQPGSREAKEKRNLGILKKMLEEAPERPKLLLQAFESSYTLPDAHLAYLRRGIDSIEGKREGWERCGPAIFRYAVSTAFAKDMPELDGWIARAEELFPDSIVTRIDVNQTAAANCWNSQDFKTCAHRCEAYFQAVQDYESGNYNIQDVSASPVQFASESWKETARTFLADSYFQIGEWEKCARELSQMAWGTLNEDQTERAVRTLILLHSDTGIDTAPILEKLWSELDRPIPTAEAAVMRTARFTGMGYGTMSPNYIQEERGRLTRRRPGYTLFVPLADRCDLGCAAAMYAADNVEDAGRALKNVGKLEDLPLFVLIYAMERGVSFPLPGKPMNLEEMDALAARLAGDEESFLPLVLGFAEKMDTENLPSLCWTRGLLLAAVRTYPWSSKEQDEEQGMALARAFARVDKAFLPLCYADAALTAEGLFMLPPMHRFGWYCAQAFEALEKGSAVDYVRLLREGLSVCEGVKDMVEFLVDHTPELQAPPAPSEELKALADQIRAVLANFAPDDPAVAALKQSEAYQKVAYLIEGTPVTAWGGLTQ